VSSYDEAVFVQRLRSKLGPFKTCTVDDIVEAFWVASWDLKIAIERSAPDKWELANQQLREEMVPGLSATLKQKYGITVL
jgi:hypothetical protein